MNHIREDFDSISNEGLISAGDFNADIMCKLKEDWIYFDTNTDDKIAQMNPIGDWDRR